MNLSNLIHKQFTIPKTKLTFGDVDVKCVTNWEQATLIISKDTHKKFLEAYFPFDPNYPSFPDLELIVATVFLYPLKYLQNKDFIDTFIQSLPETYLGKYKKDVDTMNDLFVKKSIASYKINDYHSISMLINSTETGIFNEKTAQTFLYIGDKMKNIESVQMSRLFIQGHVISDDIHDIIFHKPSTASRAWKDFNEHGEFTYNIQSNWKTNLSSKNISYDGSLVANKVPSSSTAELNKVISSFMIKERPLYNYVYNTVPVFGKCLGINECSLHRQTAEIELNSIHESLQVLPTLLSRLHDKGNYIQNANNLNHLVTADYLSLLSIMFETVEIHSNRDGMHFGEFTIICKRFNRSHLSELQSLCKHLSNTYCLQLFKKHDDYSAISNSLVSMLEQVTNAARATRDAIFSDNTEGRRTFIKTLSTTMMNISIETAKKYNIPIRDVSVTSANQALIKDIHNSDVWYDKKIKCESSDQFHFSVTKVNELRMMELTDKLYGVEHMMNIYRTSIETLDETRFNRINYAIRIHSEIGKLVLEKYKMKHKPSKAWLKLYEILHHMDLVSGESLTSVHIAEAPGNFILATEFFMKSKGISHRWFANSLNPNNKENQRKYKQFIFGDQYELLSRYKSRWLFGGTNGTGDLTDPNVIREMMNTINEKVMLVTGDAGLSMEGGLYNKQESELAQINFGQCVAGLCILSIGGSFVYKTFLPLRQASSLSVLHLLSTLFESVHITKPINSGPSNAEVYIVCKKYKGISPEIQNQLLDLLPTFTANTNISKQLSNSLIDSVYHIVDELVMRMCSQLQRIFMYYDLEDTLSGEFKQEMKLAKHKIATDWIKNNGL
jgi:hypothetical protein